MTPLCPAAAKPDAGFDPGSDAEPGTGPVGRASCAGLCASAPIATRGWLLIEHAGPWPAFGHPSDLPAELAAAADQMPAFGVRPQLIRRTDRQGRRGDGMRAVFLAGGDGRDGWIERIDPDVLTTLLTGRHEPDQGSTLYECGTRRTAGSDAMPREGLPTACRLGPATFRSRHTPGLGRAAGPLLLVCTHGRREVRCAQFGRPIAVALAARFGPLVWETTHVGGDEFAANLVLLPAGAYFGRLDPRRAVTVAERALAGQLDLASYRGMAGRPAAVQSAEWHLRHALGEQSIAALRPLTGHRPDVHRFAHVKGGPGTDTRRCDVESHYEVRLDADTGAPGGYRLVSIRCVGSRRGPAARPGTSRR